MSDLRTYVLDTNVLMHDPSALFRFAEHDVYLPMVVLEELDKHKKGISEVARNVRLVSRFIDALIEDHPAQSLATGIQLRQTKLNQDSTDQRPTGMLFFQQDAVTEVLPDSFPGDLPDNQILAAAYAYQQKNTERQILIISKDINLRIKASILGLASEDYTTDQVLDDMDLLYRGVDEFGADFWSSHSKQSAQENHDGSHVDILSGPQANNFYPNQCLYIEHEQGDYQALVKATTGSQAQVVPVTNYGADSSHSIWGIQARNTEQNFALNLLLDPDVDLVTILGTAGTGKTLLTLAAALSQTSEKHIYKEIIMTRVTVPVGDDIGFLPGTEEEKMSPWMGALMDNLEVLNANDSGNSEAGSWERNATNDFLQHRIKIKSLNFMRGRTFLNRFIIVDEAQNLTAKQMKTLITRAGPGTKVVCLGNVAQIDTPYLTEVTSGLTYVVDRFKQWEHAGHIILKTGERSRLADYAAETL